MSSSPSNRPDPDWLLAKVNRQEAEAHRGKNRPGGGAQFTFILPLGEPPKAEQKEEEAALEDVPGAHAGAGATHV